jgi:hypothetical protein
MTMAGGSGPAGVPNMAQAAAQDGSWPSEPAGSSTDWPEQRMPEGIAAAIGTKADNKPCSATA